MSTETINVKLFFDKNLICLGSYDQVDGKDYYSSEFMTIPRDFPYVGKTYREINSVTRERLSKKLPCTVDLNAYNDAVLDDSADSIDCDFTCETDNSYDDEYTINTEVVEYLNNLATDTKKTVKNTSKKVSNAKESESKDILSLDSIKLASNIYHNAYSHKGITMLAKKWRNNLVDDCIKYHFMYYEVLQYKSVKNSFMHIVDRAIGIYAIQNNLSLKEVQMKLSKDDKWLILENLYDYFIFTPANDRGEHGVNFW